MSQCNYMCEHGNEFSKLPVKRDPSVVDYAWSRNWTNTNTYSRYGVYDNILVDTIADYPDIAAELLRESMGRGISDEEICQYMENRYNGNDNYL